MENKIQFKIGDKVRCLPEYSLMHHMGSHDCIGEVAETKEAKNHQEIRIIIRGHKKYPNSVGNDLWVNSNDYALATEDDLKEFGMQVQIFKMVW